MNERLLDECEAWADAEARSALDRAELGRAIAAAAAVRLALRLHRARVRHAETLANELVEALDGLDVAAELLDEAIRACLAVDRAAVRRAIATIDAELALEARAVARRAA